MTAGRSRVTGMTPVGASGGATAASAVTNTPAGTVAATTVQAAIDELATEKVAKAGDAMTGALGVTVTGTAATGVTSTIVNDGTATLASVAGINVSISQANTAGTITSAIGVLVGVFTKGAAGTLTTVYGIRVRGQTAAVTNYGIAVAAAGTQTLWVGSEADSTTAAAGIGFGSSRDTTLFRSAAATLATNGAFKTGAAATGSRPAAATVGAGAMFYDTTLSKPIWSDGTTWRDAAGTAV